MTDIIIMCQKCGGRMHAYNAWDNHPTNIEDITVFQCTACNKEIPVTIKGENDG